jgi:hypothetical protein
MSGKKVEGYEGKKIEKMGIDLSANYRHNKNM